MRILITGITGVAVGYQLPALGLFQFEWIALCGWNPSPESCKEWALWLTSDRVAIASAAVGCLAGIAYAINQIASKTTAAEYVAE